MTSADTVSMTPTTTIALTPGETTSVGLHDGAPTELNVDGATVLVPANAISGGTELTVQTHSDPAVAKDDERAPIGTAIELKTDGSMPFTEPVEIRIPLPDGYTFDPDTIGIAAVQELGDHLTPIPTTFDQATGEMVGHVSHFTLFLPWTWSWVKSLYLNVRQRFGQIVGKRKDAPKCDGSGSPAWVKKVDGLSIAGERPIRACVRHEGDVLGIEIANNRTYGMVLGFTGDPAWMWHEKGDSPFDKTRNEIGDALMSNNQLYLPPLSYASIGIKAPAAATDIQLFVGPVWKTFQLDASLLFLDNFIGMKSEILAKCFMALSNQTGEFSMSAMRDTAIDVVACLVKASDKWSKKASEVLKALRAVNVVGRALSIGSTAWDLGDLFGDLVYWNTGVNSYGFTIKVNASKLPPPVAPVTTKSLQSDGKLAVSGQVKPVSDGYPSVIGPDKFGPFTMGMSLSAARKKIPTLQVVPQVGCNLVEYLGAQLFFDQSGHLVYVRQRKTDANQNQRLSLASSANGIKVGQLAQDVFQRFPTTAEESGPISLGLPVDASSDIAYVIGLQAPDGGEAWTAEGALRPGTRVVSIDLDKHQTCFG